MLCSVMPGVDTVEVGLQKKRGEGGGTKQGGEGKENAAPVDFGDVSQDSIKICMDFEPMQRLTPLHKHVVPFSQI